MKEPTFSQRCDKCGALVIDKISQFDEYARTDWTTGKIEFYCPYCIKKHKIVTDAHESAESILARGLFSYDGGDDLC